MGAPARIMGGSMKTALALAVLSAWVIAGAAQAAADPQVGTWKIDLVRSKYVTAKLPKASEAVVTPYGGDGAGVTLNVHMVSADGQPMRIRYSARYDGKPYPRTEEGVGATPGQVVTLRKVSDRTVERKVFLDGKPGGTETWTISADGKTRTVVQSGVDLKGAKIDNLQIYVKQ